MTMIRALVPVPTPTARRVEPAGKARRSKDHPPRRENALVHVPTPNVSDAPRAKTVFRARNAAPEVLVQIIAGAAPRGIRSEASEIDRYRRAYAQAASPVAPRPRWEKSA